jgi:Glycosyl hydrolase family 71
MKHLFALFAALVLVPLSSSGALPVVQPPLLRMRVVLTTESPAADLTLDPGTIVNASLVSDGPAVRVRTERNHMSFVHDGSGSAEARVRLLVSGVRADAPVRWHLTLSAPDTPTRIEVYNENEQGRARLVDRFDAYAKDSIFESPADRLRADGPVRIEAGPPPLVLAFFYPWYQHFNWASEKLLDQPLFLYSTEFPDEVARSLGEARNAGLDGVIVSWRGDTDWNDRRLQIVFDQAQTLGLKVSILIETLLATDGPEGTVKPFSADKMRMWLEKAYDVYGRQPAMLKTRGRPVVFVYVADAFTPEEWRTMARSLEGSGRHMFLMADSLDPAFLESFGGAFSYGSIPPPDLERFYSDKALRTQSYNLIYGGERRVDAATVSPGYNDSHLDRVTTQVVDRANGALYEVRWQAAIAAQPDWILVTSWNEFWENTHIEPSVRYDRRYQGRTRIWSDVFRRQSRDSPALLPPQVK